MGKMIATTGGKPACHETFGLIRRDRVDRRILDDRDQMLWRHVGRRDGETTRHAVEFDQGGGARHLSLRRHQNRRAGEGPAAARDTGPLGQSTEIDAPHAVMQDRPSIIRQADRTPPASFQTRA